MAFRTSVQRRHIQSLKGRQSPLEGNSIKAHKKSFSFLLPCPAAWFQQHTHTAAVVRRHRPLGTQSTKVMIWFACLDTTTTNTPMCSLLHLFQVVVVVGLGQVCMNDTFILFLVVARGTWHFYSIMATQSAQPKHTLTTITTFIFYCIDLIWVHRQPCLCDAIFQNNTIWCWT